MSADRTSAVFAAVSDPTRRALIETLARHGEASASRLSTHFPVSRQAISKHLGLLTDAGLVTTNRVGREQRYVLEPDALAGAVTWMRDVGSAWDARLAALRRHLAD